MKKANRKRLLKLSQRIDVLPISSEVEDEAFELFCNTGELPDHQRLAAAVCQRALRADKISGKPCPQDWAECMKRLADIAESLDQVASDVEEDAQASWVSARVQLFDEAVHGTEPVRLAARSVLKLLVWIGRDVTDPMLIDEDIQLPDFGSVGLHLLGFPECILKAPYKRQGRRLLNRFARLRERIDHDDRQWFVDFDVAASRFLEQGVLPHDELMREAVLANGEWTWLLRHGLGEGDAEVMAAFDRAARAGGKAADAALAELQGMAGAGRLLSGVSCV